MVMIGGTLLFVVEFKLGMPDANALAQLFLELLCEFFLLLMDTQY